MSITCQHKAVQNAIRAIRGNRIVPICEYALCRVRYPGHTTERQHTRCGHFDYTTYQPIERQKVRIIQVSSCEGVSESFRTGCLERELQMVQLSATRFSCVAILLVSLVSFAAITLYVASQRVFIFVVVYFVIDWVRKLLDTPSHITRYQILQWAWDRRIM
jgi:hypothetical protein